MCKIKKDINIKKDTNMQWYDKIWNIILKFNNLNVFVPLVMFLSSIEMLFCEECYFHISVWMKTNLIYKKRKESKIFQCLL